MRTSPKRHWLSREGFTLTELAVLISVGAMLASILVADFSQMRLKLLQQSCAANLKQWGMAFGLYAQDYNGRLFMQQLTFAWDDTTGAINGNMATNVYLRYLSGGNSLAMLRALRECPYVAATVSNNPAPSLHSYSMVDPLATGLQGLNAYLSVSEQNSGSPNFDTEWIALRTVPYPSQFLLLMDGGSQFVQAKGASGNSSGAKSLVGDANGIPAGDTTRAIDRHGGGVNMLFGDFHVAFVTSNQLAAADALPVPRTDPTNPWFCEN
jgi:prepilin-type processing-associated H-X9-DG protein